MGLHSFLEAPGETPFLAFPACRGYQPFLAYGPFIFKAGSIASSNLSVPSASRLHY